MVSVFVRRLAVTSVLACLGVALSGCLAAPGTESKGAESYSGLDVFIRNDGSSDAAGTLTFVASTGEVAYNGSFAASPYDDPGNAYVILRDLVQSPGRYVLTVRLSGGAEATADVGQAVP